MFMRSWVQILDGHDIFHIDLLYCLFEKTVNKQKEAGVGPFKKKNLLDKSVSINWQTLWIIECFGTGSQGPIVVDPIMEENNQGNKVS